MSALAANMLVSPATSLDGLLFTDSRRLGDNDDQAPDEGALAQTVGGIPCNLYTSLHKPCLKFSNPIQNVQKSDICYRLIDNYLIYIIMISVQLYMNQESYIFTHFNSHYLNSLSLNVCLLNNICLNFTILHVSDIYLLL